MTDKSDFEFVSTIWVNGKDTWDGGSDKWPGTKDLPKKTLHSALGFPSIDLNITPHIKVESFFYKVKKFFSYRSGNDK